MLGGARPLPAACCRAAPRSTLPHAARRHPTSRCAAAGQAAGRRVRAARSAAAAHSSLEAEVRQALGDEDGTSSLPPAEADALVSASLILLGISMEQGDDGEPQLSPPAVVRGLLRWTRLCGVLPRDAARMALGAPELLDAPAERIVRTMLLLRRLFPAADLSRVVEHIPMHTLVSSDADALELCALGVMAELRNIFPEIIVQLLAQEEPLLFFGGASVLRFEELREAYDASGMQHMSEDELRADMANERWVQFFRNRFISNY
jgi:hypothetical protein